MKLLCSLSAVAEEGLAAQKALFTKLGLPVKTVSNILQYDTFTCCVYDIVEGGRPIPLARIPAMLAIIHPEEKRLWTCSLLQARGYRTSIIWENQPLPTLQGFLKPYDKRRLFELGATSRIIRYMNKATPTSLDNLFYAIVKYHTQCPLLGEALKTDFDKIYSLDWWQQKASKVHTIALRQEGWLV